MKTNSPRYENRSGSYRGLTSFLCMLVLLLLLATGSSSFAKTTAMTYSGSYKGQECSVQVNWHNWSGLGPVDGHINLPDGTTIPFSGNNSRKGVLEIEAAGESVTLVKERDGNAVSWIGKQLNFSDSVASGNPPGTPKASVEKEIVKKSYTGTWRGKDCTAKITWTPGDDPGTLWTGEGQLVVEGDMVLAITGWQPRADYIEFFIAPDPTKENYKATKQILGRSISWVGRFLSLTETSAVNADRNAGLPPRSSATLPASQSSHSKLPGESTAIWVIACQTDSSRQGAEKYANEWTKRGFTSGSLWIPDYSSLSGAKMYLTYVGWYDYGSQKDEAKAELRRVKRYYPKAYGIKLDQSGRREQF